MSKKEMSARFASAKGRKGKKKTQFKRQVPSTVDSFVEAVAPASASKVASATQASGVAPAQPISKPSSEPLASSRKPGQRSWTPSRAVRGQPGLTTDYSYVTKDLKRIALTASAMFIVIAALSFVIR